MLLPPYQAGNIQNTGPAVNGYSTVRTATSPLHLATVREFFGEVIDTDFPQIAAVVYGAAAFYLNETLEEVAKNKPLNPWGR
jgi:hypothetical protein